jgi:cytoskeleton protein RodZ
MSEQTAAGPAIRQSAGALLREARQARGLHLTALSASLKVPATRLSAMEEDRWHDLPDAAYARALAHTVSRALGIDPDPVLRSLPAASQPRLESLDDGLDEPFRDAPMGAGRPSRRLRWSVVGLGLVLAAGVWWVLARGDQPLRPSAAAPGVTAQPLPAAASGIAGSSAEGLPSAVTAAGSGSAAAAVGAGSGVLRLVAREASWIELRDPQGQPQLSRVLGAGESLELPFSAPAGLTVGNAAATQVWINGQTIDLAASARENVARVELR